MTCEKARRRWRVIAAALGVVCTSACVVACAGDNVLTGPTTSALSSETTVGCAPLEVLPSSDGDILDLGSDVVTLDFGEQVIGTPSAVKSFTARNLLPHPIVIAALRYNAPYSASGAPVRWHQAKRPASR
jgi:hypothetical protein